MPLETQFSSLSQTTSLLEDALDNLFLSLSLSSDSPSSKKEEEKNGYDDDDKNEEEGREDEEMRVRHLQPMRVDVKADRRSQRRIYNQHDCLTPHNQRPYPYHASGASWHLTVRFTSPPPAPVSSSSRPGRPLFSPWSFHVDTIRDLLLSSLRITSSGTYSRSAATARGASLPRSRLEMRPGGARERREKRTRLYYRRQK